MERVVIIEYGAGNLFSVRVAIERLGYGDLSGSGASGNGHAATEGKRDGSGDSRIESSRVGDMFGDAVDVCSFGGGGFGRSGNIPDAGERIWEM